MPPPRRAKTLMRLEPSARPTRLVIATLAPSRLRATRKYEPTASSASVTTSTPVTAPPLNAAFIAGNRPSVAAWAVRTFASTAMRIPT